MGIKKINEWEKAVVFLLNLDGWQLEHCGDGYLKYDAKGKTPKGKDCVIEMKFRNKYYEDKLIEKDKYDSLMALDVVKLFFVNDPKGNFMYWLDTLEMPKPVKKYCRYNNVDKEKTIKRCLPIKRKPSGQNKY